MKKIPFPSCLLFIALCCGILVAPYSYAQTGWQWGATSLNNNNSGLEGSVIAADDSGNVILAGSTGEEAGPGIMDYLVFGADTVFGTGGGRQVIVKTDSNGHFLWATGCLCGPMGIITDHNGNIYQLGFYWNSSLSVDTITLSNPGLYTMYFMAKYSPAGRVIWAKNIVGNARYGTGAIGLDGAGKIYVAGQFDLPSVIIGRDTLINTSPTGDTFDVFVAKYDSVGNPVWAASFGGRQDDGPNFMTVTPAGNIYISGTYKSPSMTVGSATLTDSLVSGTRYVALPFFVKMDGSGHVIWAQSQNSKLVIDGLTSGAFENIYMVGYMDSGVILGADTLIDAGGADVFLAKYDSSGTVVWANSAGCPANDYGYGITLDNCNHLWISGGAYNATGSEVMNFNGYTLTLAGPDPSFIAEYDDSGRYITSATLVSGGDDALGIVADNRGSLYIGGDYANTSLVLGPDTLGNTVSSFISNEELLMAKYNYGLPCSFTADTFYQHSDTIVCAPSDIFTMTLAAPAGSGYLWYDGATAGTHIVYSSGAYWVSYTAGTAFITDTFYVTFAASSPPCPVITIAGTPSQQLQNNSLVIFPNPATAFININAQNPINQITISDVVGQIICTNNYNSPQVQIDVSSYPPGLYFVKVNGSEVKKWVKE